MSLLVRRWRAVPSVWAKFLLLLTPSLALMSLIFFGVFYYFKYQDLRNQVMVTVEKIATANAGSLSISMWSFDGASTRKIAQAIAAAAGVVCVVIDDDHPNMQYRWPEAGCGDVAALPLVRQDIYASDRHLGVLRVYYTFDGAAAAVRTDAVGAAAMLLLLLTGTVVVALLVLRATVGRPLNRFITAIQLAERFQARQPVAWESDDEIGRVIAAYNRLVQRLAEDEAALAHERNILQITLDNVEQGIVMVDDGLTVVLFNQQAAELMQVPLSLLRGRPAFAELLRWQEAHGVFADSIDDFDFRPGALRQMLTRPVSFKRRRGDGMVMEVRSNPLAGGGFVRTFTDITAEARASAEMVKALEDVEEANRELRDTQDHLVQAEKMASLALLVAGVAHEINTPIGIAFGCSTHLTNKTQELADAIDGNTLKRSLLAGYITAAEESTRLIQQNLARANELIHSFKQVAVDQTSQERRSFVLADYLGEVVTSLSPQLRRTPHRVTVDCPPDLKMDSFPGALSQVVTNLIINAVTHAFEGAHPGHIALNAETSGGDSVFLTIADDGRGIPPEHLPRIFEPFFTTRRGVGGSGLGLHIVFNLVSQTLGGRITCASAPGQGTRFTLRLPLEAPSMNTSPGDTHHQAA